MFCADVYVRKANDGESLRSLFIISEHGEWIRGNTLKAIDIVRLNGVRAIKIEMEMTDQFFPFTDSLIYFCIAGDWSYLMSFSGTKAEFEKRREEIDAIVNSFKILTDK